jgi:hypothetical protein
MGGGGEVVLEAGADPGRSNDGWPCPSRPVCLLSVPVRRESTRDGKTTRSVVTRIPTGTVGTSLNRGNESHRGNEA